MLLAYLGLETSQDERAKTKAEESDGPSLRPPIQVSSCTLKSHRLAYPFDPSSAVNYIGFHWLCSLSSFITFAACLVVSFQASRRIELSEP